MPLVRKLERCPIGGGDGKAGIGNGSSDIEEKRSGGGSKEGRERMARMARRPETSLTAMTTGGIRGAKGSTWRLVMMETEVETVGEAGLRW